jgi:hypothetical protein
MITDEEKIKIIINKLKNLKAMRNSFIENQEEAKNKYVLEDELLICDAKKQALLKILKDLGGDWSNNEE